MSFILRLPSSVHREMLADLRRPHDFAFERVGFCRVRLGNKGGDPLILIPTEYWPVPDEQYVNDPSSGARINGAAIRAAMQDALVKGRGVFHVHLHDHDGVPGFGRMDLREIPRLVQSLANTAPSLTHGMLVISESSAFALAMLPGQPLAEPSQVSVVGKPLTFSKLSKGAHQDRHSRQSFLGRMSEHMIATARVGIVGLGGGGSHIAQQLAHIGFQNYVICDPQPIEETNLNRLVGATEKDVAQATPKVVILQRLIKGVRGSANVTAIQKHWQDAAESLRDCDIVFGCVDGFDERRQLEATCRRYLVPYVDIGMDVHIVEGQPPRVAGQVILSLPGHPCMHCIGFLNERALAREAARYGDAGHRPQVVWSNGILASTVVGIAVDLLTNWTQSPEGVIYLSYDGNSNTVSPHPRLQYLPKTTCPHYPLDQVGDPF